ncbi:MAG: peptide chain release factor 1 [Vallitaleaceae bacterium]|nr:peptide chain release factor 1 [Vallitaleaceae bacterium]
MIEKLAGVVERFELLSDQINDSDVIADQQKWRQYMKEHSDLQPLVEAYNEYRKNEELIKESLEMMKESDPEIIEMAKEDLNSAKANIARIEEEIKVLLLPKDPNDDRNVIVEIRGGAGGDEAALFAAELYRMYNRFAERNRWKTEVMNINESGVGGFKEAIFSIQGQGAYSKLKFESGVHRVQRVPATESSGRIHTSTVTVAVLPEVDEVEVEINQNDLRVDVFRSSGNGGQSVNTTDSAVRITHIPTGIVVSCQDEKSQLKNRDKALKVLRSRIYEIELEKQQSELAQEKKSQVGTGDRSEKIRTYNFPQGRVTDHRIKLTTHRLMEILDGDLFEVIDTLNTADQAEKLKNIDEQ